MAAKIWLPFVYLSIFSSKFVSKVSAEKYESAYWQTPMQVSEYYAYSSVKVLEFSIPEMCTQSSWLFTALKSNDGCADRHVDIYIQYGSYPVVNPLNETYPSHFNLHRTDLQHIPITPDNSSRILKLTNPLPGSWFAITFINDYTDDKLRVKGLNDNNCAYYLGTTHVVESLESVIDLVTDVPIPLNISLGEPNKYRFYITEETWQYTVSLKDCSYTNRSNGENTTSNNRTESIPPCPVVFAVRSRGLANIDGFSQFKDCTQMANGSDCELTLKSPAADDWQYAVLTTTRSDISVSFTFTVTTKTCIPYHSIGEESELDELEPLLSNNTANVTFYNSTTDQTNHVGNHTMYSVPSAAKLINSVFETETTEDEIDSIPSGENTFQSERYKRIKRAMPLSRANEIPRNGIVNTANFSFNNLDAITPQFNHCLTVPELGRYVPSGRAFQVQYSLRIGSVPFPDRIMVKAASPIVMKFVIKQNIDIGGTLKFDVNLIKESVNISRQHVGVVSCIQRTGIPLDDDGPFCIDDNKITLNTSESKGDYIYFPYPEPGNWYLTMQAFCYDGSGQVEPCQELGIGVEFSVVLEPCVDGSCTSNGACHEYFSGVFHFSSCHCLADYRGYGCTDDSVAKSHTTQLVEVLLLTMSNLLFIPAIIIAIYRRFYVEALVYFYTMFMSTFYHACDGDRTLLYCMMPYSVLSYTDFYGSILSFWVTMVSMARLPSEKAKSFLFMVAALFIALGVQWDKHNLWVQLVPILTSLGVMGCSWMLRCFTRKTCYPSKKRWLFLIVPGILVAGAGLVVFTFFETDSNYKYTHSAWHACMAISIVFLLPPHKTDTTGKTYSLLLAPRSGAVTDELSSLADSLDSFPGLANMAQLHPAHESPWTSRQNSLDDVPLLQHHNPPESNDEHDDVPMIVEM